MSIAHAIALELRQVLKENPDMVKPFDAKDVAAYQYCGIRFESRMQTDPLEQFNHDNDVP